MARRALGPATLTLVQAVESALVEEDRCLLVACSGGPDSLALAQAVVHVGRRRELSDRRGRRRPRAAAVLGRPGGRHRRDADDPRLRRRDRPYGDGRRHRRRTRGRCPDRPLSGARRGGGHPAGDRPARPHPRRPGRDGAAGTGPRLGDPVAGRDGRPHRTRRALAAAPAGGAPRRHRAGLPRERPGALAGPAQHRSVLRSRTGAADRAADAGGRARPRDRRGAGPDRGARPRRRRSARRAGRRGGPGDGPTGV